LNPLLITIHEFTAIAPTCGIRKKYVIENNGEDMRVSYSEYIQGNNVTKCPFSSELVMEALLADNPGIISDGLKILSTELPIEFSTENPFVNVNIKKDKSYGRIDLLGYDYNSNSFVIIELKKNSINHYALAQLLAYLHHFVNMKNKEVKKYLSELIDDSLNEDLIFNERLKNNKLKFEGLLIGSSVDLEIQDYIERNQSKIEFSKKFNMNNRYIISKNDSITFSNVYGISLNRFKDDANGKFVYITEEILSKASKDTNHIFNTRYEMINQIYSKAPMKALFIFLDDILLGLEEYSIVPKYGRGAISYKAEKNVFLFVNIQQNSVRLDLYLHEDECSKYKEELQVNSIFGLRCSKTIKKLQSNPNFAVWLEKGLNENKSKKLLIRVIRNSIISRRDYY